MSRKSNLKLELVRHILRAGKSTRPELVAVTGSRAATVFEVIDDGYRFKVDANYPNNNNLVKQIIVFDKDLNLKTVDIYNENDDFSNYATTYTNRNSHTPNNHNHSYSFFCCSNGYL